MVLILKQACAKRQRRIAEIHNQQDQQQVDIVINAKLKSDKCMGYYYIGLQLRVGYAWWYNTNTSAAPYVNFYEYEIHTTQIHCAYTYFANKKARWKTDNCQSPFCVICEEGKF